MDADDRGLGSEISVLVFEGLNDDAVVRGEACDVGSQSGDGLHDGDVAHDTQARYLQNHLRHWR